MQSLLIIGYVWPEPTATAAGSRMLQIMEQFQNVNYQITFASAAIKPATAFDLTTLNVEEQIIELNNSSFDELLKQLNPSVVLFDRFLMEEQFGWRVQQQCPEAFCLLDSEDLHFLRRAREQAVKKGEFLPKGPLLTDDAKREIASIYRCDATLTISEFEVAYLKEVYKIDEHLIWYFPFLVDVLKIKPPCFEERKDFVFIGNFMHAPNWDAVLYLKKTLWPILRKRIPQVKLHIYGSYASQKVLQLHNPKENFLVYGRATSVEDVMKVARICLVPLRFGAGLKGKLMDAMQTKTPFVTTKIGAEGMFGAYDFSEVIALDEDDFIEKSVALYNDKKQWELHQEKGIEVLKNRFSKQQFTDSFSNELTKRIQCKTENREQNFIGAMLQHHSLKSTMYLSKWIEEKNKN